MSRKFRKPGSERWGDIRGGMAFVIPVALVRHPSYRLASPYVHKLIADLSTQYTGYNNGYLCAAWSLMRERGWRSRSTLEKACAEAEHYRILERTQQGGRNRPNLYAFTWRRIDRVEGRKPLDVAPTLKPSDAWDAEIPPFTCKRKNAKASPPRGLTSEKQARDVGKGCTAGGLAGADKPTTRASRGPTTKLPSPPDGHLTIVASSRAAGSGLGGAVVEAGQ